jgi:hypothetical protein
VKNLRVQSNALKEVVADLTLENRLLKKSTTEGEPNSAINVPSMGVEAMTSRRAALMLSASVDTIPEDMSLKAAPDDEDDDGALDCRRPAGAAVAFLEAIGRPRNALASATVSENERSARG